MSADARRAAADLPDLERILHDNPGWLDEAVTTLDAAQITGRPIASLETLRVRGGGPPFVQHRPGGKVTYRRRDLFEWMAAGLRTSTSQSSQAQASAATRSRKR